MPCVPLRLCLPACLRGHVSCMPACPAHSRREATKTSPALAAVSLSPALSQNGVRASRLPAECHCKCPCLPGTPVQKAFPEGRLPGRPPPCLGCHGRENAGERRKRSCPVCHRLPMERECPQMLLACGCPCPASLLNVRPSLPACLSCVDLPCPACCTRGQTEMREDRGGDCLPCHAFRNGYHCLPADECRLLSR